MEKVVYFLGAGFSAPLGIPTSRGFYQKSKDLHYGDQKSFSDFGKIFEIVDRELAFVKNYYTSDQTNIEEILSILAMRDTFTGANQLELYRQYIKHVIEATGVGA
ncbi:hypothetical protein HY230_01065 [Candidatus Acetothermia bacterium]|nr:hypothetical protein [Candidatus Acetothermia bacterium]